VAGVVDVESKSWLHIKALIPLSTGTKAPSLCTTHPLQLDFVLLKQNITIVLTWCGLVSGGIFLGCATLLFDDASTGCLSRSWLTGFTMMKTEERFVKKGGR
jgi:hypothetical protein